MSLYPINSHPWNTFAVNAGLIDLLSSTAFGVGTSDVTASLAIGVSADITGVATSFATLGITAPIGASATGVGTSVDDISIFYYGAVPVLISDWDVTPGISPVLIQLINWDQT